MATIAILRSSNTDWVCKQQLLFGMAAQTHSVRQSGGVTKTRGMPGTSIPATPSRTTATPPSQGLQSSAQPVVQTRMKIFNFRWPAAFGLAGDHIIA
ncbi:hypothetical protein G7Z17_g11011 [Cylindrodendrum hubeiense]|uniref:Uncharacterized protein n=1 Tax=Cylindrodendrum hubeiense TaxID=595255 RepID=A0A9P5L4A8_9HYPO|nr:hypothetical protein G7Z17_g11011 [Cylindrodendrum hubeiense]